MILQENVKMIEMSNEEILILIIGFIIFFIIIFLMFFHTYISDKLHKQYHKGYNKAKDDKVQYYKTIKELIDSFDKVLSELKKDNTKLSIITTDSLIKFKNSLQNYYQN